MDHYFEYIERNSVPVEYWMPFDAIKTQRAEQTRQNLISIL